MSPGSFPTLQIFKINSVATLNTSGDYRGQNPLYLVMPFFRVKTPSDGLTND